MKLTKGQKAPNFKASDIWGNEIELSKTTSQKTLLTFFRFAECAMCNIRVAEIMKNKQQLLDKDIRVIAVFESPADSLKSSITDRHLFDFTIIANQNRNLYELYQVKPSWLKMMKMMGFSGIKKMFQAKKMGFNINGKVEGKIHQIPADFLIDKTGIIEIAHYGNSIFDHIDLNKVLK